MDELQPLGTDVWYAVHYTRPPGQQATFFHTARVLNAENYFSRTRELAHKNRGVIEIFNSEEDYKEAINRTSFPPT